MANNTARTKDKQGVIPRRRSASLNEWELRVSRALKALGDRSELNRSPLARLAYIETLAINQHQGHLFPRGLALHDVFIACVNNITTELGGEPKLVRVCSYLKLLVEGLACKEISTQLGLSREHVSRVVRRKAIELLTEEFLNAVKTSRRPQLGTTQEDHVPLARER